MSIHLHIQLREEPKMVPEVVGRDTFTQKQHRPKELGALVYSSFIEMAIQSVQTKTNDALHIHRILINLARYILTWYTTIAMEYHCLNR